MSDWPVATESSSSKTEGDQPKPSRTNRACDACRRKKVRCGGLDGDSESCAECLASGSACTFQDKSVKRGPPRGYVQALEARLAAMESLLASLTATSDLDSLSEHAHSSAGTGSPMGCTMDDGQQCTRFLEKAAEGNRPSGAADEQSAILDHVDKLADDLADLSVNKVRYVGRASGIHIAQSIHEISEPNAHDKIGQDDTCEGEESISLVESILNATFREKQKNCKLPPAQLGKKLVSAYFDKINAYYPLLHRPYFDRCLATGALDSDDTSFKGLYFAVCALGARYVDDESLLPRDPTGMYLEGPEQSRGYDLFISATDMASPKLIPATLFDIQNAALGVMWLTASASPTTAWSATGHAVRRLIDIGIHRERSGRWLRSPMADQLRKRAFIALYDFDRNLSSTLGRPVALHESEFDVIEPLDISDADLDAWEARGAGPHLTVSGPGPLSGFLCMHRLRRITERVLQTLYSTSAPSIQKTNEIVCELDSLLNDWLAAVPPHLQWNPSKMTTINLVQSAIVHTSYYVTQLFVHREFLNPAKGKFHSFPSLAICSNASRSIANVLDVVRKKGALELGCHTHPVSAVSAAMILLINVFSNSPSGTNLTSSAMADVNKVLQVLKTLSSKCYMAMRCSMGLEQFIESGRMNQRFAAKAAQDNAPHHKRAAEDDSPANSSLHSPDSTAESPSSTLNTSQGGTKKSRPGADVLDLPMTTEQLGQSTFIGRPTLSLPTEAHSALEANSNLDWLNSFLASATTKTSPPITNLPQVDPSLWAGTAWGVAPTAAMLAGLNTTPSLADATSPSSATSTNAPFASPDAGAVSWDMFSQFDFTNLASTSPPQQSGMPSSFSGLPDFGVNFGNAETQPQKQAAAMDEGSLMDFSRMGADSWSKSSLEWNNGPSMF